MKPTAATIKLLLSTTLAAFAATGCGVDMRQVTVQEDLAKAAQVAEIGQIEKAKVFCDQAIKADPQDVDVYVFTGADTDTPDKVSIDMVFANCGDIKTQEYYLQQASTKFPKDYRALSELLDVQQMLGETDAAKRTANELISRIEAKVATGKIDSTMLTQLGVAYAAAGNQPMALATFKNSMSFYPDDWQTSNAEAYGIADTNSKPDLPKALALAQASIKTAQKKEADESQIAEIRDTLGWVEYRMGNYNAAANEIETALNEVPREPELRYHRAMVYLAQGDKQSAKEDLAHALTLAPDYADAKTAFAALKDVPDPAPVVRKDLNDPYIPNS